MIQDYCRGDIFFITEGAYTGSEQNGGRPGVIVSNDVGNKHSPNVEVVFLTSREKKPMPTHVEVLCKVPSTALCENIQTVSKERLDNFIRSCSTSEMKNIDNALLCSLGIHAPAVVGGGLKFLHLLLRLFPKRKSSETCTRLCMNSFWIK